MSPPTEPANRAAAAPGEAHPPTLWLALPSAAVAAGLAWAAVVVPWGTAPALRVGLGGLALVHGVTAVLAAVAWWFGPATWSRARRACWRAQSVAALAGWGLLALELSSAAFYLAGLYGSLGAGVAAALIVILLAAAAPLVPLAIWGLVATRPRRSGGAAGSNRTTLAALVLAAATSGVWALQARRPRLQPLAGAQAQAAPRATGASAPAATRAATAGDDAHELSAAIAAAFAGAAAWPRVVDAPALMVPSPAACASAPADAGATVIAAFVAHQGASGAAGLACHQAASLPEALAQLRGELDRAAAAGPVAIDVVIGHAPVGRVLPWATPLDALALRPGLDGVCAQERCFAPWQLVALDQFRTFSPFAPVPEATFGVDLRGLEVALRGRPGPRDRPPALTRIVTRGFVRTAAGELVELDRMQAPGPALSATAVREAGLAAEVHVLAAQRDDGRFRYLLDPFRGRASFRGFSIPRQAGTTMTLCELGSDTPAVRRAIGRAGDALAAMELTPPGGAVGMLHDRPRATRGFVGLGSSALGLVALATCHGRDPVTRGPTIGRLARFLLAMQRPDGGFHARWDLARAQPQPGPDALYAAGQAVYGLVLVEALARAGDPALAAALPPVEQVHAAVERAMDYFAGPYWAHGARDLFFLEENWHCLAARAALAVHRHGGYEQLCLDYLAFKRRMIFHEGSRVAPDLVGGYGLGHVVTPHHTPAAGFGEALAAGMAIRAARGEPDARDPALMGAVLTYLLHHQWRGPECFACTTGAVVEGAWLEHVGSPELRIDYVQHAWAALGHGGAALGLADAEPVRGGARPPGA